MTERTPMQKMADFLHERLKIKASDTKEIASFVKDRKHRLLHIYIGDQDCDSYSLINALVEVSRAESASSVSRAFYEIADCLAEIEDDIVRRLTIELEDIEYAEDDES